jgi:hypothetical protein
MNIPSTPDFDHDKGVPGYERGKKWPAWFTIALPFIGLLALLARKVKNVSLISVAATVLFFEIATFLIEHRSVMMGHWVYNRARIFGVLVWGVPIEELVIYYFFPPIFVILIMQWLFQYFSSKQTRGKQ